MEEWAYCPSCWTRTSNERREDGKYYCTCGVQNPNIREIQEAKHGKQAETTTQAMRGKGTIHQ